MAAPIVPAAAASGGAAWSADPSPAAALAADAPALLDERCLRHMMPASKEQLGAAAQIERQLQGAPWRHVGQGTAEAAVVAAAWQLPAGCTMQRWHNSNA